MGISILVPFLKEPGEVLRSVQQWKKSPLRSCGKRRRWSVITPGNSLGPYDSSWSPHIDTSHLMPSSRGVACCSCPFFPSPSFRTKFLWRYLQLTFSQVRVQTNWYEQLSHDFPVWCATRPTSPIARKSYGVLWHVS